MQKHKSGLRLQNIISKLPYRKIDGKAFASFRRRPQFPLVSAEKSKLINSLLHLQHLLYYDVHVFFHQFITSSSLWWCPWPPELSLSRKKKKNMWYTRGWSNKLEPMVLSLSCPSNTTLCLSNFTWMTYWRWASALERMVIMKEAVSLALKVDGTMT